MREIIVNLFGSYTPLTFTDAEGNIINATGLAGVDWEWVAGCAIFCICLISVFKFLGVFLKR